MLAPAPAIAQTVSMSGAFTGKALLIIDGAPRTVAVGDTVRGVKLLSVNGTEATVEVKGKRVSLALGGAQVNLGGAGGDGGDSQIVLSSGSGGHFVATSSINGKSVRFMVDTGASAVGIGVAQAKELGIEYLKGERGMAGTANGAVGGSDREGSRNRGAALSRQRQEKRTIVLKHRLTKNSLECAAWT